MHVLQVTWAQGFIKNMIELFDRCFLHDGHIGSGSSFFTFDSDVDSVDWEVPPEE